MLITILPRRHQSLWRASPCWRNRNRTFLVDEDHESSIADAASSRFSTPKHSPTEVDLVCESWCCCTCKQRLYTNPCSFNFLSQLELILDPIDSVGEQDYHAPSTMVLCYIYIYIYSTDTYIVEYKWTI